jgi:uncharacterized protein
MLKNYENLNIVMSNFSPELISMIVDQSSLSRGGYHSLDHWIRVLANGRKLSKITGANIKVVELFSLFHDSRRLNEGYDPEHGPRGAAFAAEMRGQWFDVSDQEMEQLEYACEQHSNGITDGDITVQTCWDADRLDLGRVGKTPNAEYLCTHAAKHPEMIKWSNERATKRRQ